MLGERMIPRPKGGEAPVIASETSGSFSDWDVYRFGLFVGLRALPVCPWEGIKQVILPVEYVRCVEFRYVLKHLDVAPDHLVLDIGSPKLLSLFLAAQIRARVHATDLLDYFFRAYGAYADSVPGLDRARYVMETQDARGLSYPNDAFDRVFSVSAIEHIPLDDDSGAMREIARVLKPGGLCCLTVPWSDSGYAEVFKKRDDPDAYWITSDEEAVFYQRLYDRDTLEQRLLNHHGLETVDVSFLGERNIPVEALIESRRLPRILRYAMLPAHFPLSRWFLRELTETEPSRKKVACLTLRKPLR